jgi:hypothetical protein
MFYSHVLIGACDNVAHGTVCSRFGHPITNGGWIPYHPTTAGTFAHSDVSKVQQGINLGYFNGPFGNSATSASLNGGGNSGNVLQTSV